VKKRIVIAAVLVAIGAGGVASWRAHGAGRPPQAPEAVAAVPVVAAKVAVSDVPIELTGIGTVMAYNLVHVNARVTGTIEQIGIVQGQTVHPGSLIAELDPRPFQAALKEAEANLARDQASLANAEINLNRYIPLLKPGYASAQQVADQESAVSEAKAQVEADKAAIFNAATQLSYTRITSPIDGVTGILGVDIGNIVQAGAATPIVTITQIQPIYVDFTLPQDDLPAVQAAMAKGALSAVAYGQDDRTELGRGTLLLVNNTINQSDGTMQLRATFPNANRALWPGEFVNVRLVIGVRHDGITVPMSAVQQGQSGSFVFVVAPDGTARERPVSVAETIGGRALIDKGLEAGDTVVTAGQYGLADGAKVAEVGAANPRVQDVTEASAGML
jgi:membrane fusion protein, multidrug efflux system